MELKISVFKSPFKQSCKAHMIGQIGLKDQSSISLFFKSYRPGNNSLPASFEMIEMILQNRLFSTLPNPQTNRLEHFDAHWKSFSWIPQLPTFCWLGGFHLSISPSTAPSTRPTGSSSMGFWILGFPVGLWQNSANKEKHVKESHFCL